MLPKAPADRSGWTWTEESAQLPDALKVTLPICKEAWRSCDE